MLNTICTRKEKTQVILFFEIYKMMLIIFKSENCSYTGDPPKLRTLNKLEIFLNVNNQAMFHVHMHAIYIFINIGP